ncbi:hypothetical protein F511_41924 [Dorcoceras hygrometricum]|uniref:Uncharacterized protein n=1 Tax=Dorcoceras hygrometricum TaxID=472368 RepID=A0A2Z7CWU0_9LAMI|nr:hypothetical protein F511_41924 [Dorcoceras hygrometricum]
MMNSRRICPAVGSQYNQSAVGLVFRESAAGLAMETSKVESAVRNKAKAKIEPAGAYSRKLQWIQSQRKDFQTQCLCTQTQEDKSIVVEEDSGEAIDEPDASNSSIQSRAYMNQLLLYIQSQALRIHSQTLRIQSQALESQTQEKKKQAKCRNSTSRELQYPVVVMDQQRSS